MHATALSPELDLARSLDERLVAAPKAQRGAEHRLAILLAERADTAGHRLLGYASIEQYAMTALELTSRVARDLLRIGRGMPELPRLNAAPAAGDVDWTKEREVVRVATAATDAARSVARVAAATTPGRYAIWCQVWPRATPVTTPRRRLRVSPRPAPVRGDASDDTEPHTRSDAIIGCESGRRTPLPHVPAPGHVEPDVQPPGSSVLQPAFQPPRFRPPRPLGKVDGVTPVFASMPPRHPGRVSLRPAARSRRCSS